MHRAACFAFAISLTVAPAVRAYEARILSTVGQVSVARGNQSGMVTGRATIAPGDRVVTSDDGAASLLVGGSIVYLGARSHASLSPSAQSPGVEIRQGSLRVVVGRNGELPISTPQLDASLAEGIYQVAVEERQSRLHTVAGKAAISRGGRPTARRVLIPAAFQSETGQSVGPGETLAVPPIDMPSETAPADLAQESEEEKRRRKSLQDEAADEAEQQQLAQQDEQLPEEDLPPSSRGAEGASFATSLGSQSFISSSGISTSFGGLSASFSLASGGLFADAAQSTNEGQVDAFPTNGVADLGGGSFPGNIHLLTAESRYALGGVALTQAEMNAIFPTAGNEAVYFSIGAGALPTSQVFTDFLTASEPTPTAFVIPGFSAYVVKFTEFGLVDAGLDPSGAEQNVQGITGLVGLDPPAPSVVGATPTADERAVLNDLATFALGEVRLRPDGGTDGNSFEVAVRRSDQDRLIVKDGGGNDANDLVTPHPDVEFTDVADPRFQPAAPTVKSPVPSSFDSSPTQFSQLNDLRRAAVTTVMANQLYEFAQRTGQTRFVVDGRIIDISGYQK